MERLRHRLLQTEVENQDWRDAIHMIRDNLARVNLLLDEVLDIMLPSGVYGKLSEAAETLAEATQRLH